MTSGGIGDSVAEFVCITVFRRSRYSSPERCDRTAVWGTPYCARHGGDPSGRAARKRTRAAEQVRGKSLEILREAGLDMGRISIIDQPREVDPAVLLLEEVSRSAGIIKWLEDKIASLEEDDEDGGEGFLTEVTTTVTENKSGGGPTGNYTAEREERRKEVTIWWRLLQEERKIAQAAATSALRSNIEERRVRLAERSVNALEAAMAMALMDLGLDPHNERVRAVVGSRLREALAEGSSVFGMEGEAAEPEPFQAPSARIIEAGPSDEPPIKQADF